LFLLAALAGGAQQTEPSDETKAAPSKRTDPQFDTRRNQIDPDRERLEKEQQKRLNKDRHAALKKDTDRLLELATELKMAVDKSNENMLSLDVVKKADAIEKLAHSVKEKMKGQ
jgi:hypothetical protein